MAIGTDVGDPSMTMRIVLWLAWQDLPEIWRITSVAVVVFAGWCLVPVFFFTPCGLRRSGCGRDSLA